MITVINDGRKKTYYTRLEIDVQNTTVKIKNKADELITFKLAKNDKYKKESKTKLGKIKESNTNSRKIKSNIHPKDHKRIT